MHTRAHRMEYYLTANKNVLSTYDKPIAIVYARYNRSSMLVLVHFISKFQHDM